MLVEFCEYATRLEGLHGVPRQLPARVDSAIGFEMLLALPDLSPLCRPRPITTLAAASSGSTTFCTAATWASRG